MWGMYWRYLVAISLILIFVAFLSEHLNLLDMVNDSGLLPTFFWFIIAVFFISITFFQNKGLPYVFLGGRLHLPDKAWSRFNLLTIYLFLGLAIIGYFVNQLASKEVWSFYKLFGQSLCLLLLPLLSSWSVVRRVKNITNCLSGTK